MQKAEQLLFVKDVARMLGLSEQTIRSYADQGILKERRNPHKWRVFLLSEVEELKEKLMGVEERANG